MTGAMPFDVFMVAYGEPNAEANWARLKAVAPQARRIDNVPGIAAAYAACAAASRTPFFFAVDGDNWMLDGFRFEAPFEPQPDETVLWYAKNPVNGLCYAHGGIKLLPTALIKAAAARDHIDFTTSITRNRYTEIAASEHRFNGDPYSTWAGAFRECAKLAVSAIRGDAAAQALSQRRLAIWCNRGAKAKFGAWSLRGAQEGRSFGLEARDPTGLGPINDFDWLRARFRQNHVRKIQIPPSA